MRQKLMGSSMHGTRRVRIALIALAITGLLCVRPEYASGAFPTWTPSMHTTADVNGSLLVSVGDMQSHRSVLLAVAPSGQAPHVLLDGIPGETAAGPSPRGRYVALAEGGRGLWLIKSDGTGLSRRLPRQQQRGGGGDRCGDGPD